MDDVNGTKRPRRMTRLKKIAWVALAVVVVPYLCSRGLAPLNQVRVFGPESPVAHTADLARENKLKIVAYNIAHGRGMAETNWAGDRLGRLGEIAQRLKSIDADVVVLNEVDFDCSWSHGINQAAWIAQNAGYNYRVEECNLDFRVLFWRWRFGNAVLSKHPISDASVIDLPGYAMWESVLAGKKRAVACTVRNGDRQTRVIGAHLSPRSESLRVESCKKIIAAAQSSNLPCIVAGDFNSAPAQYPAHEVDDLQQNAIDVMDEAEWFTRIPRKRTKQHYTFPANDPNRIIDWIFILKNAEIVGYSVDPSELSDHRAVVATIQYSDSVITKQAK